MRPFKEVFFCFLLLLLPCLVNAQGTVGKVKGIVYDSQKTPIIGVSVSIKGSTIGVQTDLDGKFELQHTTGQHTILFNYVGMVEESRTVQFNTSPKSLSITMQDEPSVLDDVVVSVKGKVDALKEQAFTISAVDMQKIANSTYDLNQILNKSSGIKVRQQGGVGSDYNFSVNGMSGKAVKFFVDGVPLEMLGKGVDMNTLPINMAQRVEIYKGVVPVHLSTDAMGGAVDIITNGSSKDYLDASYMTGSFNTHKVNLNGQLKDKGTGIIMRLNSAYNYSDNDYKMRDMKIYNPQAEKYEYRDVKRFNDRYKSLFVMAELGIEDKSWADMLFVGVSHSLFDKQIQTGSNQEIVYGGVKREGDANNYFLKYKKKDLLNDRFDINYYLGYSKSLEKGTDTLMRKYSWDGSYVPAAGSELSNPSLSRQHRDRVFSQLTTEYRLSDSHKFNFNYMLDYVKNQSYNLLYDKREDAYPTKMTKQIFSINYQQDWFDKRWTNVFFGKYYLVDLDKTVFDSSTRKDVPVKNQSGDWGYGVASTFKITNELGLKASFEKSFRLLEPEEIFGDGVSITSNLALRPESSNNFNLGVYYSQRFDDHFVRFDAAGYIRDTKDYIYTVPNLFNSTFKYENLSNIFTRGVEGEFNYQYKNILNIMANITYNYAYDNTKYANNSDNVESATYKKEVPNQPWLYGNIDVSIGQDDWFQKDSRIELTYGVSMTEWFYKNWQSYGNKKNIPTIPRQTLHDVGINYSIAKGKYNFALNCTNIGNALAYDNFKLQKQGRAFYFKFRYSLK
ncbi:TonB-dependent receptor [Myroides odoratimimus]|uniref:TonB-dependent receptor n=1 Tax=Myroides TaxID=76831 RepID=UPI002578232E|nr:MULTISPECIES: TonB-dependent receptor [Myroides]MDM1085423.1 TonB-dependent receptor [Myroides odoratimimus]MDM1413221.1 TonB-dependent receptor [Myroides odoratimimus]MDM1445926.1 TonB-dependent receptor [Myroides odoratimimus]MDM1456650.1 TonB-dependent receptor [Myroides odoratimimus]MDM1484369.1 TonB-dependent receptor [Myroides odoratimimus]